MVCLIKQCVGMFFTDPDFHDIVPLCTWIFSALHNLTSLKVVCSYEGTNRFSGCDTLLRKRNHYI